MNDLERILESGKDLPAPDGLTERIKDSIDGQLAGGAGVGGSAAPATSSSVPIAAWAAGLLVVGVLVVLAGGIVGGSRDSEKSNSDLASPGSFAPIASGGDTDSSGDASSETPSDPSSFDLPAPGAATPEPETVAEPSDVATGALFGWVRNERGDPVAGARVSIKLPGQRRSPSKRLSAIADDAGYYEASLATFVEARSVVPVDHLIEERLRALDVLSSVHFASPTTSERLLAEEAVVAAELRTRQLGRVELEARDRVEAVSFELIAKEKQLYEAARDVQDQLIVAEEVASQVTWAFEDAQLKTVREQDFVAAEKTRVSGLEITALFEGFQPTAPVTVPFTPDERTQVDLVLRQSEALTGVVVDVTGQAIVGAVVEVVASFNGSPLPTEATRTTSGEEGSFSFEFLPPGQYLMRASGEQIETVAVWVETGETPVTLLVPTAGVVTVSVVDEAGEAIYPVSVELTQKERLLKRVWINGARGERFEGISPGEYGARVMLTEGVYPALEETFTIAAGEEAHLDLVIPPAVTVEGHLDLPAEELTEEGTVRSGQFLVAAYHLGGTYSARRGAYSPVNESGEFTLPELPAGHYVFGVAKRMGSSMIIRSFRDVSLSAGNGAQVVRLPYAESLLANLQILVEDEAGNPIPRANITFERARTMGRSTHSTDKAGQYQISLHPDPFDLIVEAKGYERKRLSIPLRGGATNKVRVTLEPRATQKAALAASLREEGTIVLHHPITVRSLFAAIDLVEPGAIAVDPELADSRLLDEKRVGRRGISTLRQLLGETILTHGFEWELEGARLHLSFGEVNPR